MKKYINFLILTLLLAITAEARVFNATEEITIQPAAAANIILDTSAITASKPLKVGASKEVLSGDIDLTTEVTGTLPIANGGTGSATQNFVDLTTVQTVAGNKTFSGKLAVASTTIPSLPCPVMTEAERDLIGAPVEGDCVFNSTSDKLNIYALGAWGEIGSGSGGDVVGPASAVDSNVAMFDGVTGKLIKDSGLTLSGSNTGDQTSVSGTSGDTDALNSATTTVDVAAAAAPSNGQVLTATSSTTATWQTPAAGGDVVGPASAVDSNVAMFDGVTGKLIKDSGLTLSGSNTGDQTSVTGTSGDTDALNSATTTVDVSAATAPTAGQVLRATSGTAATWQTLGGLVNATDLVSYTPTFTGFGTAANVEFFYAREGQYILIEGKFDTGTVTGTEARISLPGGLAAAGAGVIPSKRDFGSWTQNTSGTSPQVGSQGTVLIDAAGRTYMTFGTRDASFPPLNPRWGSEIIPSSTTMTVRARIPIAGWSSTGVGQITNWVDAGVLTIGATTSAPTKGTTSNDKMYWRRVGDSMEIRYEYKQTGAGTAGSGDYLFSIPAGYTIDSSKVAFYTTVEGAGVWNSGNVVGFGTGADASKNQKLSISVYNTTQVRAMATDNSGDGVLGSGYAPMTNAGFHFNAYVTVPIVEFDL